MKIVEVVWRDSTSLSGHISKETAVGQITVIRRNTGYVIDDTENDITLVSGIIDFKPCEYDRAITIHKGCVESIREIGE